MVCTDENYLPDIGVGRQIGGIDIYGDLPSLTWSNTATRGAGSQPGCRQYIDRVMPIELAFPSIGNGHDLAWRIRYTLSRTKVEAERCCSHNWSGRRRASLHDQLYHDRLCTLRSRKRDIAIVCSWFKNCGIYANRGHSVRRAFQLPISWRQ